MWGIAALLLMSVACADEEVYVGPDAIHDDPGQVDPIEEPDCDQLLASLQQYADSKIESEVVASAGIILGVDTPECGTQIVAAGMADVESETPMTSEHILPIADVSSTFVGTVVLQLADEGVLDLDDKLSEWRTDIPNADFITIRHLLSHRSGVQDYQFVGRCWTAATEDLESKWTIDEMLDCIDGLSPKSAPGAEWHYSDTNNVLLADIVERATGNALHEEIRRRLLSPLGLEGTFTLREEAAPGEVSRSYLWNGSWTDVTELYNPSFWYASENMASSASDLLTWAREMGTGSTLNSKTFAEMADCGDMGGQEKSVGSMWETGYGLHLSCAGERHVGALLGHVGVLRNTLSQMWYSPSWDSSVVVLLNRGGTGSYYATMQSLMVSDVFGIVGRQR